LISCRECLKPFCLKHRHPQDHKCGTGKSPSSSSRSSSPLQTRKSGANETAKTQLSLVAAAAAEKRRLQSDEELARALQTSLYEDETADTVQRNKSNDSSCVLQ
jgi:hypothetical protein